MTSRILFTLATLMAAGPALADNAAMLRCRTLSDGPARLACYDAIALPGIGSRAGWGAPVAGAPAPGAVSVTGAPAAQSPADRFGLEGKSTAAGGPLDKLESSIPGRFEGWNAKTKFRLANGQVWAVAENSSVFYNLVDPKVVLKKGLFDVIYLEVEGVNQRVRVRRVQ